jgi:hypothetical protein
MLAQTWEGDAGTSVSTCSWWVAGWIVLMLVCVVLMYPGGGRKR